MNFAGGSSLLKKTQELEVLIAWNLKIKSQS